MQTRKFTVFAGVLALALPCVTLVACHGKSANSADKISREMPEGAEWKGVYFSQIYGNLHLVEADGELLGSLPVRMESVPNAVNLLVPPGAQP